MSFMAAVRRSIVRILLATTLIYILIHFWLPRLLSPKHSFGGSSNKNDPIISETLVVACGKDDDMTWLQRHPFPIANVIPSRSSKGNEALAYLQYIVDNYETLSDVTIFIHNQETAWHNSRLFSRRMSRMLAHLDREFVLRVGYFNLRCEWEPGCPARLNLSMSTASEEADPELDTMHKVWPELHPDHPVLPGVLAQPCCSQFAASRERIHAVALDRWIQYRDWVLAQTDIKSWLIGRLWEYTWQFVLSENHSVTTWCPSEQDCYCFGYGVCFAEGGGPGSWEEREVLEEGTKRLKEEYMVAIGRGEANEESALSLHKTILAKEAELEDMLEAAMRRGDKERRLRDVREFKGS